MKYKLFKKNNKFKNFFKKYKYELYSFIFPILIFSLGLLVAKMKPFGPNMITIFDGKVQYPGFASYFAEVLRGKESIFYSFNGSFGFNFYAAAVYYLFNPTNLLLIFFKSTNIQYFYSITVLLKIGLSGLTMFTLLKYKHEKNIYKVLLSMAYALSAYNVVYYSNYMWFDSIVLFPLVILGLKKLIYERKKTFYFVTLFLSIFSNFYIGYMICIFCLLYFIYSYFTLEKKKRDKKIIFDFLIVSFLAGLSNAIILIPVVQELLIGKAVKYDDNFTKFNQVDLDAIKIFYKFTPGNYSAGDISYGSPNVYCTLFTVVLSIFYFFNSKISKREKIASLIFIAFFLLSFTYNLVDYSWHMFQRPIWYPARYSFTFIAFLIMLADKSLDNIDHLKISAVKTITIAFVLTAIIIFGAYKSNIFTPTPNIPKYIFFFLSFLIIFQYFIIIKTYNKAFKKFIVVLFIIEIASNTLFSLKNIGNKSSYSMNQIIINNNLEFVNYIKNIENENEFYRTYTHSPYIANNNLYFDYKGIKYFSSVRNNNTINLIEYILGVPVGDHCNINWEPENPILNSLFGIKYLTSGSYKENSYEFLESNTNYLIYKNNDAAKIGFMTYDNLKELENKLEKEKYISNINYIAKYLSNQNNDIIEELDYTLENLTLEENKLKIIDNNTEAKLIYTINNSKAGYIIVPKIALNNFAIKLYVNGEIVEDKYNNKFAYYVAEGTDVTFEYKITYSINFDLINLHFIENNNYKKFINEIKESEFNITEYKKDNYIKGIITSTKDKNIMFTTISADKGWSVYIDGIKTEYDRFENALITVEIPEGTHEIEFKYIPTGFTLGLTISTISLFMSACYLTCENKTKK